MSSQEEKICQAEEEEVKQEEQQVNQPTEEVCQQQDEEQKISEQHNALEEDSLEYDLSGVDLHIDELIAEREILEQELKEYLPDDALILKEEKVVPENSDDYFIDVGGNQSASILKVETEEVEEEVETYEIVGPPLEECTLESSEQQEIDTRTEEGAWEENVECDQKLEKELEADSFYTDQAIDEMNVEEEFTKLESERELEELNE
ncbi:MAG: hypothetical protein ACFE9L_17885 [Candidatus Hodarchaeota archaeon]